MRTITRTATTGTTTAITVMDVLFLRGKAKENKLIILNSISNINQIINIILLLKIGKLKKI